MAIQSIYRGRRETLSSLKLVLDSGQVAVKGQRACIDTATGRLKVAAAAIATLIPIGVFTENLTGDGTLQTLVLLDDEIAARMWDNDTNPNSVTAADVGSVCYLKDGKTVTKSSSGNSVAGIVLGIDGATSRVIVVAGLPWKGATGTSGRGGTVATRTALAAIAAGSRADGDVVIVTGDGSQWYFSAASSLAADGLSVEGCNIVIVPGAGTGRWLRKDSIFVAKIPIGFGTADAAQLMLVPAGYSVKVLDDPTWDVTTGFTGGTASAIGISGSNAGINVKGDLLGGASGDVTATLGSTGIKQGTVGAKMGSFANRRAARLEATEYLRFDRITSAFTTGAGFVHVPIALELVG